LAENRKLRLDPYLTFLDSGRLLYPVLPLHSSPAAFFFCRHLEGLHA